MTLDVKRRSKARRISDRSRLDARSTALTASSSDVTMNPVTPSSTISGTAPQRHATHGRSARHGFDHDEAERLRPVDRKQDSGGVAEKRRLLAVTDLAKELDPRIIEQGLDHLGKVGPVNRVDLRGDLEFDPCAPGDGDGRSGRFSGEIRPRKAR